MGCRRRLAAAAGLSALVGLAGCGTQPISHPLYIVVADQQHLYLDVLSAGAAGVPDRVDLGAVGATPPAAGVAIASGGYVIVTNTAAVDGSTIAVKANTQACTVSTHTCASLLQDGGSDSISSAGQTLVVPVYAGTDISNGRAATIAGGPPPHLERTIPLPPGWVPGRMALSPDGRDVYWLTAPATTDPSSNPAYVLLEYELSSGRVLHRFPFGTQLPGALCVAANGTVYVAITYTSPGTRNPPVPPSPGRTIDVFGPDATLTSTIGVGERPSQLAIGDPDRNSTLAILYQNGREAVDLVATAAGRVTRSDPLPSSGTTTRLLSTLANGDFAVVVGSGGGSYTLGIVPASGRDPTWQTYAGDPASGAAG